MHSNGDMSDYSSPVHRGSAKSTDSIDDDMVAANALSFGGIASSKVVAMRIKSSFSKEKSPPPPFAGGKIDGAPGKSPPPPPPYATAKKGKRSEPPLPPNMTKNKGGPPPPPPTMGGRRKNSRGRGNDAMGFAGDSKMSMMGNVIQKEQIRNSLDDRNDSGSDSGSQGGSSVEGEVYGEDSDGEGGEVHGDESRSEGSELQISGEEQEYSEDDGSASEGYSEHEDYSEHDDDDSEEDKKPAAREDTPQSYDKDRNGLEAARGQASGSSDDNGENDQGQPGKRERQNQILDEALGFNGSSRRQTAMANQIAKMQRLSSCGSMSESENETGKNEAAKKAPPLPPKNLQTGIGKKWAPISKRRSVERRKGEQDNDVDQVKREVAQDEMQTDDGRNNSLCLNDIRKSDGGNNDSLRLNDIMGYVGSHRQSDLVVDSEHSSKNVLGTGSDGRMSSSHSSFYMDEKNSEMSPESAQKQAPQDDVRNQSPSLRTSLKKAHSSPFQSDISGVSDLASPSIDDGGEDDIKSAGGGRHRRRKSKKDKRKETNNSFDTDTSNLSAIEKLKLAHAQLYDKSSDDGNAFKTKDVANLLESSIADLQAAEDDEKKARRRKSFSKSESYTGSGRGFRDGRKSRSSRSLHSGGKKPRSSRSLHNSLRSSTQSQDYSQESVESDDESRDPSRKSTRSNDHSFSHKSSSSRRKHHSSRRRSTSGHSTGHRSHRSHRSRSSRHSEDDTTQDSRDSSSRRRDRRQHHKKSSSGSSGHRSSRSKHKRDWMNESQEWEGATKPLSSPGARGEAKMAPIPKAVKQTLLCVRGGEALPRETVVSSVVRKLVSKIDRTENDDDCEGSSCVAILSSPSKQNHDNRSENGEKSVVVGGGGEGKTTIAALTTVRGDIRTRYHHGIAWLNLAEWTATQQGQEGGRGQGRQPINLDFEAYSKALSEICRQIGIKPQTLRLSPVVRTPGDNESVAGLKMRGYMREAHMRMGKLLTSLQRKKSSRSSESDTVSVLVVLDDVTDPCDVEWFQFRRRGDSADKQINDLLVTSRLTSLKRDDGEDGIGGNIIPLTVPPLETREGLKLLLTESDLPANHPLAKNRSAKTLIKECRSHPLTVKFAGRWLSLKRATSGGQKGIDEILSEVQNALEESHTNGQGRMSNGSSTEVDILYTLLNRAMSPLVKGKETKIVRLCFAALIEVFYNQASCSGISVPLEIANDFFLKVVENEKEILAKEDMFFQSNGRHASKLVPEILGALGIFNITKHTTNIEGSEKQESSIQIDHDLVRLFSGRIREDEGMSHLIKSDANKRWNEAYVQSYFQQKAKCLWDDIQPDRSRKYALENMPGHMILAGMFDDAEALLGNESFIRGRFWSLGWTEGTRAHVKDAEAFCTRLQNLPLQTNGHEGTTDPSSKLVDACKQLEAVLMEEVARESGGPNGRCSTLEAGRCLHEISVSLARFNLWEEASRFCDSCVELVESNLGPSELVASLLFNGSVMHLEAHDFEGAEQIIGDCLDMRVKTCGTESILYVRSLCQLGDILSLSSDYSAAESCFNKSIGILKVMPARYHLDFGIALYKLGRNQHRRGGYLDEALHCYEEALEFEKNELGPNHIFMSSILMHIGDLLLDKEDTQQAKHTFKEALDVLIKADSTSEPFELEIKLSIVQAKLHSIADDSDECIKQYQRALALLQRHRPTKKRTLSEIFSLIGAEQEKKGNYQTAEKCYEESVGLMKSAYGPFHLDIAEKLVNLSGVKSALGEAQRSEGHCAKQAQATGCLEEAIDIQKSRLGDCCEEVAITITIFASHLKAIGDFKKSELAYNDAVRVLQEEEDTDLSLADAYLGMADLMKAMSKFDRAMEYYNQCLEIQESVFGKKHDDIASTLYAMGLMMHELGSYSDALVVFAKSLVMRVHLHGDSHPDVADTYDMMGFVEAKNGELDTSLRRLTDALKVRKLVGDALKESDTLVNIGNLHRERKEFELALERYDECQKIRETKLGRNHKAVADVIMSKATVQHDMGNTQKALALIREALEILAAVHGPNDASVASTFQKAGMMQFLAGNLKSGCQLLEKAVETYRKSGERYEPELVTPLFIMGNIHNMLKQEEEARRVWNDAFEMSKKVGSKSNPDVHQALTKLLARS